MAGFRYIDWALVLAIRVGLGEQAAAYWTLHLPECGRPRVRAARTRSKGLMLDRHVVTRAATVAAARRIARTRCSTAAADGLRIVATAHGYPIYVLEHEAKEVHGAATGARDGGGDLTGIRIWEAAPVLIQYLERHRARLLTGRSLLDVGAGTGAVGIAAAAFGARHAVLSDADTTTTIAQRAGGYSSKSSLELLAENVELNGAGAQKLISVAPLQWGNQAHIDSLREQYPSGFDVIVASDTLYYEPESTYAELAVTIRSLAAPEASIILSYVVRHGQEHSFVNMLLEHDFECVGRSAADDFSLNEPTHAPRVVELRGVP